MSVFVSCWFIFFFQAEDGIRDLVRSRGLGDVYKRQNGLSEGPNVLRKNVTSSWIAASLVTTSPANTSPCPPKYLSLIHI